MSPATQILITRANVVSKLRHPSKREVSKMIHRLHKGFGRRTIAVVAVVIAAALGGVAWAGIPGSDGVIHSCYNAASNPSGQLRVIDSDAGTKCAKNEKALSFNQTGPKGDKGDQGIQGIPGPQGLRGPAGADGIDGTNGTNGINGTNGTNATSDVHQASNGAQAGPLSVSVPAGSYLVVGYASVSNNDTGDPQYAVCSINGAEVTREYLPEASFGAGGNGNLAIMGTVTLASAGPITVDCGGFDIYTSYKRMFVTKVTSIING
jgi:hypothetical protein